MVTEEVDLGYWARPDSGSHGGVVLIHDVWGLSDHARDLSRRLADEGFAVLAVDLYRREANVSIADPGEWIRNLSDPQISSDVQAGVDWLSQAAATAGHGIGVVGFCMGGMCALMAGGQCTGVSGIVPFYGLLSHSHGLLHSEQGLDPERKPVEPLAVAGELACPMLGIFGGRDEFVPIADIEELERRTQGGEYAAEVVVYPEAGHAFMNDTRPAAYRAADAADAWRRMTAFLHSVLD